MAARRLRRPNFAGGSATSNVPACYYFNPSVFARPVVLAAQPIPSSGGTALAGAIGTDIGNLGSNALRGPKQTNFDFSLVKRFPVWRAAASSSARKRSIC